MTQYKTNTRQPQPEVDRGRQRKWKAVAITGFVKLSHGNISTLHRILWRNGTSVAMAMLHNPVMVRAFYLRWQDNHKTTTRPSQDNHKTTQDETTQHNTRGANTRQYNTRQDNTRQHKTKNKITQRQTDRQTDAIRTSFLRFSGFVSDRDIWQYLGQESTSSEGQQ